MGIRLSQKMVESPNTIIQIPNAKMADVFHPCIFCSREYAVISMVISTNCRTALRKPNPSGPTFRMSCAKLVTTLPLQRLPYLM
jgi:hypothetical protein